MYKTILCAIEASPEGKTVLSKAAALADSFGAKLIAIHVLPYTFLPNNYQRQLKEDIIPKVEKITTALGITKKNCIIKVGKPYQLICREAIKRKADLVIIGTHSKRGLHAAIGSTATGVANNAECDVTLIRI